MLSALFIVLPIFGLIATGWFARRFEVLGPAATTELNRFVLYLGFPALLFDITAHARWSEIWLPGFTTAYCLSALVIFVLTLGWRLARAGLAMATLDGLNAGYANTGFVGLPLSLAALGPAAAAPTTITIVFNGAVLFSLGLVLIEIASQTDRSWHRMARTIGRSLLRNPMLVAPCTGLLVALAGLPVPAAAEAFLKLLGGTTSCCALVALGLFLGTKRQRSPGGLRVRGGLLLLKLVAQPTVALVLAVYVLQLSPDMAATAVLLAATPTGTGSFVLAEVYGLDAGATPDVVLLSTIFAVVTLPICLTLMGHSG